MAVIWDQVQDQQETKAALKNAFLRGHLAHGLLFSGANAALNKKMALGLAQTLVCEQGVPCGICGPCRRIELEQSENLKILAPESGVIKIDQVRELRETLALQAWQGRRAVIIEQAHSLNPQAANALLKSLEEPPENTFFLLLTTHERSLLPTIRSRVQVVRVVAPLDETVEWGDDDAFAASVRVWSLLAQGLNPRGEEAIKELFSSRDSALETIRIWSQILHRARRKAVGAAVAGGRDSQVIDLLKIRPPALDRGWQSLVNMKAEIEGQVDRMLAVDSFLIHVSEGFRQ